NAPTEYPRQPRYVIFQQREGPLLIQLNPSRSLFFARAVQQPGQSPVSFLYCASVKGTTESRPWRTSGDVANSGSDLICASDTGFASAFPGLLFSSRFFGMVPST